MLPEIHHPKTDVQILSGGNKVKIRPMTLREEKTLMMAKEAAADEGNEEEILQAIVQIVDACTDFVKEVKAEDLPMFDIEWLYLKIRSISVSDKVRLSFTEDYPEGHEKFGQDPKEHTFEIDLKEVKAREIKEDKSLIEVSSDISIKMKYPPVGITLTKEYQDASPEKQFDMLLGASVETIVTTDEMKPVNSIPQKELVEWLNNIPSGAFNKIQEFFADTPSIEHVIKYKDLSGKEQTITLSTLQDFFLY